MDFCVQGNDTLVRDKTDPCLKQLPKKLLWIIFLEASHCECDLNSPFLLNLDKMHAPPLHAAMFMELSLRARSCVEVNERLGRHSFANANVQHQNMASTWFGGCSRKCIIYAIAAVILIFLIILLNFAYLPGRRFTVGKNIDTSSSLKVSATRAIPVTTKSTITSTPKTITPKVGIHKRLFA